MNIKHTGWLLEILEAYNEFTACEYEDEPITLEELSNFNGIIPIAHTMDDTGTHPVQVSYDLENECYLKYIDEELIERDEATAKTFIDDLYFMSFDDFVSDLLSKCDAMEDEAHRKALIILDIFKTDGYSLKSDRCGQIVVAHEDCDDMVYRSWCEFLDDWKESVSVDVQNGLYYFSADEYVQMGIKF